MEEKAVVRFSLEQITHNLVRGTGYIIRGNEKTSVALFQKDGQLQVSDIERARILTTHYISNLEENISIHPVLKAQMIVTHMGANILFHCDKRHEDSEDKLHSAFFRINTLTATFSNLLSGKTDEFKPARQFKHEPLRGLWYKHVEDASISGMAKNVIMSNNRNDWLLQRCKEEFGEFNPEEIDEFKLDQFVRDQMLNKGLERRKNKSRMTGEWLIFEKKNNQIHFLTLASHQEDKNRILARVKGKRFPSTASPDQ